MASTLISPGVQTTIIDQSQYLNAPTGTIPFILIATEENKTNPSGTIAQYTTPAVAGQLYLETSQRSLINDFGTPIFQNIQGSPINADELNEYGLMAAYSSLGVSDSAYIMRAPIDLSALNGTVIPPTSAPSNGTLWLDTTSTNWGILQYNAALQTFIPIVTTNTSGNGKLWVITNTNQTSDYAFSVPLGSIGKPGDYAVVTTNINNPVWYMNSVGTWVEVGTVTWQASIPTAIGSVANPVGITGNLVLNNVNVVISSANVTVAAADVNAASITGVGALVIGNRLGITATSSAANSAVTISGTAATQVGITNGTYYAPAYKASPYTKVPQWNATDTTPEPTGSVWFNTTPQQSGANISLQNYNSSSNSWIIEPVSISNDDAVINYSLDPLGGGINIPAGTFYAKAGKSALTTVLYERIAGSTTVTGTISNTSILVAGVNTININTTIPGSSVYSGNVAISFNGPSTSNLVSAINGAAITGITASLTSGNLVQIQNTNGGSFYLNDGLNTPLEHCGVLANATPISLISNWIAPYYVVNPTAPTADPTNGTLWYYDDPTQVDIMINTGSAWVGYHTLTNDVRGANLALTDPNGPIISASAPVTQSTGNTVVNGDLWINTSNLDNLPNIYRLQGATGIGANIGGTWTSINNSDHTSSNGIVFADARWATSGNVDPTSSPFPTIASLINSNYLDSDAPSYALYPRGTLLYNTRRSGMNVKTFTTNYLSNSTVTSAWVTASGNDENGIAYLGSSAQRNMVVESLISTINNSTQILEEFYPFNLISCPGYPEVLPTLVELNINRGETAFIVSDSPLTLAANANTLNTWANNLNGATTDNKDGLVTYYNYAATYYPAGLTTDLSGKNIVVPSSHMAIPTIIQSDAVSFPWFAPAGPRRGLINNATSIGYVDEVTGNFIVSSVPKNLRDVLYPASVNPISNILGSGLEIYGQKTRAAKVGGLESELSRINVARLVIYIRGALAAIANGFLFEQNDSGTRRQLAFQIGQFLTGIQANRGISDWYVDCSADNNPPAAIDANELYCSVFVAPLVATEFIYIPITIVGSGVLTNSGISAS